MANVFDQFDGPTGGANIFDQFDAQPKKADPKIGQPEDLTFAEKYVAPLLEKTGLMQGAENIGVSRGGAVGRVAQGLADPGVAIVQTAANALPGGAGQAVNKAVQDEEQKYQAARAEQGSSGFDPLRFAGNAGMDAFIAAAAPGIKALDAAPALVKTAIQGAGYSMLNPVTDGGDNFWKEKAKDAAISAVVSPAVAAGGGLLARIVSPNASVNPSVQLLRDEGVRPTVGQTLGGLANSLEEKAQSLPFVGSAIQNARGRAAAQLEDAAYARAADPIGATVQDRGYAGISDLAGKIGNEYDRVLPKLSVNVLDPTFVGKLSSLRQMVQTLPQQEAQQFDNIIAREIDGRLQPNGTLSGQALKDTWNALRDKSRDFMGSNDAYQKDLGRALKQAFQELKDQVSRTNTATDVSALKNADFAYANFKRLQRAASYVGADEGRFSPSQLNSAVKAMDRSKDKAGFASGQALMQDLAGAGKTVLGNKVPNSGTADRSFIAGLAGGLFHPGAVAGMAMSGGAYTAPVQNALAALIAKRPANAPAAANYIRQLLLTAAPVSGALLEGGGR
jgi:hypothetical protein